MVPVRLAPGFAAAVNATVPLPLPVALGSAAAWFTVNVRPATAIVPERAAPRFGSTRNPTDPFPFPLAPVVNEIHVADFVAVHAHPAGAVTPIEPVPPTADSDALVGLSW